MRSRLTAVGEEIVPELIGTTETIPQSSPPKAENALTGLLLLSLKALSQRAVTAAASLVDLALIASAFVLWWRIIKEPTPLQLTGVAGYAAFVLTAILLRRRT